MTEAEIDNWRMLSHHHYNDARLSVANQIFRCDKSNSNENYNGKCSLKSFYKYKTKMQ